MKKHKIWLKSMETRYANMKDKWGEDARWTCLDTTASSEPAEKFLLGVLGVSVSNVEDANGVGSAESGSGSGLGGSTPVDGEVEDMLQLPKQSPEEKRRKSDSGFVGVIAQGVVGVPSSAVPALGGASSSSSSSS